MSEKMVATLALDVDGTLYKWLGTKDFTPEGIRHGTVAYDLAKVRVAEAYFSGWSLVVLTGRSKATKDATLARMKDDYPWLYHHADFHFIGDQDAWMGWDAYQQRKVQVLASMQNAVYVGDLGKDQEIAKQAGVGFIRADFWRRGYPYTHVLPCVVNSVASATNPTREQENSVVMGSDSDTEVGA